MAEETAWCNTHAMNHWTAYECGRMKDNDLIVNGHCADRCPRRIDISMIGDGMMKRWAHGDCMPKKPPGPRDVAFKLRHGNREYSVAGDVDCFEFSQYVGGQDDVIRLVLHGSIESRAIHAEPHIKDVGSLRHPAKRCVCQCKECVKLSQECICKECGCN